jgi:hypothetical protein
VSSNNGRQPPFPKYHSLALLALLWVSVSACQWSALPPTAVPPTPTTRAADPTPTTSPPTIAAVTPTATPLLEGQTTAPTRLPTDLGLDPGRVFIHPGPELYAGDQVTFQFVADLPPFIDSGDVEVVIYVNQEKVVADRLNWRNFANEPGGLYPWVWDTTAADGRYEISIILDPENKIEAHAPAITQRQVTLELLVRPAEPAFQRDWLTVETDCCRVHAINQTAAHRDIEYLAEQVEIAFADASASLQEPLQRQYDVYFIDRVIGQGGYAASSLVISYLDRNYTGLDLPTVLHHEAVHLVDRQFAPNRIPFLAEGVAVWAAGGHYKPEDLDRRAAALLTAGLYIPLVELVDDFYPSQHEIGYLQAGSFVSYLVTSYGWTAVRDFYANPAYPPAASPTHSDILDFTLQSHFNQTLAEVEANWLAYLAQQRRDPNALPDLQTTIFYYETLRAYQSVYDPSAYFLTAWLPLPEEAQQRGVTADFSRRPEREINIILETMLSAAHRAMYEGDFSRAQAILSSVNRIIDSGGQFLDPLSQNYRQIVQTVAAAGYVAQTVDLQGNQAAVTAVRAPSLILQTVNLTLNERNWIIVR